MARSKLKKIGFCMAAAMVLTLSLGIAAACAGSEEGYTVTFYDGTTVITTREVAQGGTVAEFEPSDVGYEKEGFAFDNWYATADFTHDWSFDTQITADTNVYSSWYSTEEDTRRWTIAGESSMGGPLREIGWNGGISEDNLLTKAADRNEFTITIDL